jgi:hypothetical protein
MIGPSAAFDFRMIAHFWSAQMHPVDGDEE